MCLDQNLGKPFRFLEENRIHKLGFELVSFSFGSSRTMTSSICLNNNAKKMITNSINLILVVIVATTIVGVEGWVPKASFTKRSSSMIQQRQQRNTDQSTTTTTTTRQSSSALKMSELEYNSERIRNFSIIAHIDHGMFHCLLLKKVCMCLWNTSSLLELLF